MKFLPLPLCLLLVSAAFAAAPSETPPPIPLPDGVLFGAYIDFGETEDHVTLEGIEEFEQIAGKPPAIIGSSSYWGEQSFPSKNLALISRHGALPMVYWSPWDLSLIHI